MQDNIRIEKERKYWDKIAPEYEHSVIEKETIKHPEDRMPIHDFLTINGGDILRYLGLLIFITGYIFMVWAPLHLGKQFSWLVTVQEEHELITDGPFRYMRHPRYSGIILKDIKGFSVKMMSLKRRKTWCKSTKGLR